MRPSAFPTRSPPSARARRTRTCGPSMSTVKWPISAPKPLRAAVQPAVEKHAAADAGPERDEQRVARRRPRRRRRSRRAAATLASLSTIDAAAGRGSRARRGAAPRRTSAGSASSGSLPSRSTRPAAPTPTAAPGGASSSTIVAHAVATSASSPACGDARRSLVAAIVAVRVEQDAEHLRAADVEPDVTSASRSATASTSMRRTRRPGVDGLRGTALLFGTTASAASITRAGRARGSRAPRPRGARSASEVGASASDRLGAASPAGRRIGHTNSTSSRSPTKRAPADLAAHEAVGQARARAGAGRPVTNSSSSVRPSSHVVALGERQVHREHERRRRRRRRGTARRRRDGARDVAVAVERCANSDEVAHARPAPGRQARR